MSFAYPAGVASLALTGAASAFTTYSYAKRTAMPGFQVYRGYYGGIAGLLADKSKNFSERVSLIGKVLSHHENNEYKSSRHNLDRNFLRELTYLPEKGIDIKREDTLYDLLPKIFMATSGVLNFYFGQSQAFSAALSCAPLGLRVLSSHLPLANIPVVGASIAKTFSYGSDVILPFAMIERTFSSIILVNTLFSNNRYKNAIICTYAFSALTFNCLSWLIIGSYIARYKNSPYSMPKTPNFSPSTYSKEHLNLLVNSHSAGIKLLKANNCEKLLGYSYFSEALAIFGECLLSEKQLQEASILLNSINEAVLKEEVEVEVEEERAGDGSSSKDIYSRTTYAPFSFFKKPMRLSEVNNLTLADMKSKVTKEGEEGVGVDDEAEGEVIEQDEVIKIGFLSPCDNSNNHGIFYLFRTQKEELVKLVHEFPVDDGPSTSMSAHKPRFLHKGNLPKKFEATRENPYADAIDLDKFSALICEMYEVPEVEGSGREKIQLISS